MNIINITDDNMILSNCTDENSLIEISPLIIIIITIIPCALSIICCLSFLSYGFIKVLINKKIKSHRFVIKIMLL